MLLPPTPAPAPRLRLPARSGSVLLAPGDGASI
jgi:hypothetical protein